MTNARGHKAVLLLNQRALTTTTATPASIDLAAYANLALKEMKVAVLVCGTTGTTPSVTVSIEESTATNGTFAAPATYTAPSAVTTDGLIEINFRADKRYIRLPVTMTANTTSVDIHAVAFVEQRFANS